MKVEPKSSKTESESKKESAAESSKTLKSDPKSQISYSQKAGASDAQSSKHGSRTNGKTAEKVPTGFRGTVNTEKKYHTRLLPSKHYDNKVESDDGLKRPDSYVTVTKSVTGSIDNTKNPPQENKNFASTYYTKSSTCGYFTFTCNIVYGANGRSKICRPKTPTNGKC